MNDLCKDIVVETVVDGGLDDAKAFNIIQTYHCDFSIPEVESAVIYLYRKLYYHIVYEKNDLSLYNQLNKVEMVKDGFSEAFDILLEMIKDGNFNSVNAIYKYCRTYVKNYVYGWNKKSNVVDKIGIYDKVNECVSLDYINVENQDGAFTPIDYYNQLVIEDLLDDVLNDKRINEESKKILYYHVLMGYSFEETSKIMNLNENTVKTKYYATIKKAKQICFEAGVDSLDFI